MRGWAWLAVALLIAGCADPAQVSDTAEEPPDAPHEAPAPEDPFLLDAPSAGIVGEDAREEIVPIDWHGELPAEVCVPVASYGCAAVVFGSRNEFFQLERDRPPTRFELTVSWEASSPLTHTLRVIAGPLTACGENCWGFAEEARADVQGGSPLLLEVDALPDVDSTVFALRLYGENVYPEPLYGTAHASQSVHVEGFVAFAAGPA